MTDDYASRPVPDDMPLDKAVISKSKYLSKEDCEPPILVQIAFMTQDDVEGDHGLEQRAVLNFHGDTKPLILNNTNKELLKIIFPGIQTTGQLKNQQIVLYNDATVMFGKKMVGGIRIRSASQPAQAPQPQPQTFHQAAPAPTSSGMPQGADQDYDPDIPY